jgi:hypothetical protein
MIGEQGGDCTVERVHIHQTAWRQHQRLMKMVFGARVVLEKCSLHRAQLQLARGST